jgi:transposase
MFLQAGSGSDPVAFMAEAHPMELRVRVVQAYESGEGSYSQIGARFTVGEASVKRWVSRKRRTGGLDPQPKGGGTPSTIERSEVDAIVSRLGDPTAGEVTAEFNRGRRAANRVHVSSMKRALHRYGYVVKKNADDRWRVCGQTS